MSPIYGVKTCFCEWEDMRLCIFLVLTPAQLGSTHFSPLTFARKITKKTLVSFHLTFQVNCNIDGKHPYLAWSTGVEMKIVQVQRRESK